MTLTSELARWLREMRVQWFAPADPPLNRGRTFFFAFLGSSTWSLFIIPTRMLSLDNDTLLRFISDLQDWVGIFFFILLFLTPTFLFPFLISLGSQQQRYGPVRLYLSGLMLPTMTGIILELSLP